MSHASVNAQEAAVLRRAPLFQGLPEPVVAALAPAFVPLDLHRDATVFREGETGTDLYVVVTGRVSLSTSDGHLSSLLTVVDPGGMFGELSLFDPGPRTTTATALASPTRLAVAQREAVLDWVAAHPAVSARLLQVLARRLRRTNSTLRDLVFVDVPGRVAGALLDMAERYSAGPPESGVVEHGLTQAQLAQLVDASRETVNKALADFVARGWLTLHTGGRLDIHDWNALRARARRPLRRPESPS